MHFPWANSRPFGQLFKPGCLYYLQLINGHPRVGWEAVKHRNKKLDAARPMGQQWHYADQVEKVGENVGEICKLRKALLLPGAHWWQPRSWKGIPGASAPKTGDSPTNGQWASWCRSSWRSAWTHPRSSRTLVVNRTHIAGSWWVVVVKKRKYTYCSKYSSNTTLVVTSAGTVNHKLEVGSL